MFPENIHLIYVITACGKWIRLVVVPQLPEL